jgi:pectinesterase inhibitor-like protein
MDQLVAILSVILFAVTLPSAATEGVKYPLYYTHTDIAEFIRTSCNVTLYPQLCVSSLSSYAGRLKAKQSDLVKAAVTVSLLNARNVSVWAAGLKAGGAMMSETENAALKDCIGNFRDATYEIRGSLYELKHLKSYTFRFQISNVQTWMSAALTDQDSCLNGFQDLNASGNVTTMVAGRVQNVRELISNALALVNTFAATGGGHELHV